MAQSPLSARRPPASGLSPPPGAQAPLPTWRKRRADPSSACHPAPLQGRYRRDHDFYHSYHAATRTAQGFAEWLAEWVIAVADRDAYLAKLGERWPELHEEGIAAAEARF